MMEDSLGGCLWSWFPLFSRACSSPFDWVFPWFGLFWRDVQVVVVIPNMFSLVGFSGSFRWWVFVSGHYVLSKLEC